jgi:invasion protein IalB
MDKLSAILAKSLLSYRHYVGMADDDSGCPVKDRHVKYRMESAMRTVAKTLALTGFYAVTNFSFLSLAAAAPENGKVFENWTVQCAVPRGSDKAHCTVSQTLLIKENNNRLISFEVGLDDKGGSTAAAILPLGIVIPVGVTLHFDNNTDQAMPIQHSETPSNC